MDYIQKAIELAIEKGWRPHNVPNSQKTFEDFRQWHDGINMLSMKAVLDPLFWQSLGKSLGWKETITCPTCKRHAREDHAPDFNISVWLYNQHRFIDHLAEGKDADSFFAGLLSK